MDNHKRRIRYKGKHPRNYNEKYKELQPEKYAETVEKVKQKGSTPAGMHIPICVKEILDFLQIVPGQRGLDATLGYGGHSLEMLKSLDFRGHLHSLDVDPIESKKARKRLERLGFDSNILTIHHLNFSNIDQISAEFGLLDFVLADLGVSSMQIDNPARGFSYKTDGLLDLRLNPEKGISATQRLQTVGFEELQGMLSENADEPYAKEIATAIIAMRKGGTFIDTTTKLQQVIADALMFIPEKERKDAIKKSCQRSFQALRIDINHEYEVLYEFLEKLPHVLVSGGRVAILTFHSGEDRLVKKSFKQFYQEGLYSEIATDVIRASATEQNQNPRSKSAKLRWAIKK